MEWHRSDFFHKRFLGQKLGQLVVGTDSFEKDEMKSRKALIIQDHKKGLKRNYFFLKVHREKKNYISLLQLKSC